MTFLTIIGASAIVLIVGIPVIALIFASVYELTGWHPNKNLEWYEKH